MKTLVKISFLCGIIVFMAFSCEKENEKPPCIKGEVFGFFECGEGVLIQIENMPDMGNKIVYKDVEYENVIQAPGEFPAGEIYFTYREYNRDKDYHLFQSDEICQMIYGPYDVPIIVITNFSQTKCPE